MESHAAGTADRPLHRLGQTRDVHIYNLVTEHTIEEHIMYLLHKKINMFQEIIGELDAILLHLKLDRSFESELMRIFLENDEKRKSAESLTSSASGSSKANSRSAHLLWTYLRRVSLNVDKNMAELVFTFPPA